MTQDEFGPSPSNLIGIFLAQFHVRTGNEIVWQLTSSDDQLDLKGVEWKALPSGAQKVERETIFFEPPSTSLNSRRLGVASFRNRKLDDDSKNQAGGDRGGLDQRGARMVAVGVIVECSSQDPISQLKASTPHLRTLESLAEAFAENPDRGHQDLESYFQKHVFIESASLLEETQLPDEHNPTLQLPALISAVGPIFPGLIKRLLQPTQRLLIYSTPPLSPASSLAFNLSLIIQSSFSTNSQSQQDLLIRGLMGLHDITQLSEEDKSRTSGGSKEKKGWIAWTTDKLLFEKPELYDLLLDLTPLVPNFDSSSQAIPKLFSTVKVLDARTPRKKSILKSQTWTARELRLFTELDSQAVSTSEEARSKQRSGSESQNGTGRVGSTSRAGRLERQSNVSSTRKFLITLLTLIRYYLAGVWFLPQNWTLGLPSTGGTGLRTVEGSSRLIQDDERMRASGSGLRRRGSSDNHSESSMPGTYQQQENGRLEISEEEEASNRASYARSLAEVWTSWSENLARDVNESIQRKVESRGSQLVITSRDLSEMGLSSANQVDVQLVKSFVERISNQEGNTVEIIVKKDWWRIF